MRSTHIDLTISLPISRTISRRGLSSAVSYELLKALRIQKDVESFTCLAELVEHQTQLVQLPFFQHFQQSKQKARIECLRSQNVSDVLCRKLVNGVKLN